MTVTPPSRSDSIVTNMRVLYCTDSWPPQVNGVSVVTALSVAGLLDRGWDVHVVAPRYPVGEVAPRPHTPRHGGRTNGLGITTLASVPLPVYSDVRLAAPHLGSVVDAVARFKPDLVHCATEFVIGRLGQMAAQRAEVPIITSYHTDFGRYAASYGVPWLRGSIEGYLGRFHRRAVRTLTPSTVSRESALALGAPRVDVWGCGVDIATFTPHRRSTALREQLGLGDAFTVLYVGRLAPEKNVEVVLDAFAAARALRPDIPMRLVIAGAGPSEAALRARGEPDVMWMGALDREHDLPALYASADCFAFASVTETLGLVVLEAMASGLPVVAAPVGGVREHLRDDYNGLTYAAHDASRCARAMVSLASSAALRARLSEGALHTATALDWRRELDRLDAIYRECVPASITRVNLRPAA